MSQLSEFTRKYRSRLNEYIQVSEQIKALKAKREEIKKELVPAFEKEKIKCVHLPEADIRLVEGATGVRIDTQALKEQEPLIFYKYSSTYYKDSFLTIRK